MPVSGRATIQEIVDLVLAIIKRRSQRFLERLQVVPLLPVPADVFVYTCWLRQAEHDLL
jgi:hypothetical protein